MQCNLLSAVLASAVDVVHCSSHCNPSYLCTCVDKHGWERSPCDKFCVALGVCLLMFRSFGCHVTLRDSILFGTLPRKCIETYHCRDAPIDETQTDRSSSGGFCFQSLRTGTLWCLHQGAAVTASRLPPAAAAPAAAGAVLRRTDRAVRPDVLSAATGCTGGASDSIRGRAVAGLEAQAMGKAHQACLPHVSCTNGLNLP